MPHVAYPAASDLSSYLAGAGVPSTVLAVLDLTTAAQAGVDVFEQEAGRIMLATTGTRTLDPPTNPRGVLNFGEDLAQLTSLTVGGTLYVSGTDYYLTPHDAALRGKPYWGVELLRRWYEPLAFGQKRSVVAVGKWGYGLTLLDAVWQAMLVRGAWSLLPQLTDARTGGVQSWERAGVHLDYGGEAHKRVTEDYAARYEQVVNLYKRRLPAAAG